MNDLISRQEAIDAMCCACGYDCDKSKFVYNAPQDEQVIMCPEHYALSTLPSVQPRKGKWIYGESEIGNDGYYCSVCGNFVPWKYDEYDIDFIKEFLFCPCCGADMRSEAREYLEYGKLIAKGIAQGLRGDAE